MSSRATASQSRATASAAARGLSAEEVEEIREAFNLFDTTGRCAGAAVCRRPARRRQLAGHRRRHASASSAPALLPHCSGSIDTRELTAALSGLGFEAKNATVYQMIAKIDKEGSGQVDFHEFLELMAARVSDKDSREDVLKVFALFDAEGKGRITLRDLTRVAKELGETLSEAELLEMIERADSNGDGEVSREDFVEIMTKKTF